MRVFISESLDVLSSVSVSLATVPNTGQPAVAPEVMVWENFSIHDFYSWVYFCLESCFPCVMSVRWISWISSFTKITPKSLCPLVLQYIPASLRNKRQLQMYFYMAQHQVFSLETQGRLLKNWKKVQEKLYKIKTKQNTRIQRNTEELKGGK